MNTMVGILIAVLLAALLFWLCTALGLPVIVGVIAAGPAPFSRAPPRAPRLRAGPARPPPPLRAAPPCRGGARGPGRAWPRRRGGGAARPPGGRAPGRAAPPPPRRRTTECLRARCPAGGVASA